MRKLFIHIFIFALHLTLLLTVVQTTFAADSLNLCPDGGSFSALCDNEAEDAGNIIGFLINVAFILAVVIALFYLIWGGIKWILSGGDKAAVETARATIVAAVIGLIVTFAAYFILNIVVGLFIKDFSLSNIELPTLGE